MVFYDDILSTAYFRATWSRNGCFGIHGVNIAFKTLAIRGICERQRRGERAIGIRAAETLRERLADIDAIDTVADLAQLLVGICREIDDVPPGRFAIDLADDCRIVFCANHPKNPVLKGGTVDWSRVQRVQIVEVGRD